MNEITHNSLSHNQWEYLKSLATRDEKTFHRKLAPMVQMLADLGLIEEFHNNDYSIDIAITDLGRAVLAQADSGKSSLLDTVEADVNRAIAEGTAVELTESDFAVDEKPTTIKLWEFLRSNYAEKIRAKECQVSNDDGDLIERINATPIERMWNVYTDWGKGEYYVSRSGSSEFTVTWLPTAPTVPAQPADASGAGEAAQLYTPLGEKCVIDGEITTTGYVNVKLENGYRRTYQINQLGNIGRYYAQTVQELEAELATAKAEAARLREALEFYADTNNWTPYGDDYVEYSAVDADKGQKAEQALQAAALNAGEA